MGTIAEARALRGKAAYTLVDMNDLPKDIRDEIVQDANVGGKEFGVEVVESFINGPVSSSVYGVYHFNQEKWAEAKAALGISAEEVDESAVHAGPDPDAANQEEAALRTRAQEAALAAADRVRTMESDELRKITGDEPSETAAADAVAAAATAAASSADRPVKGNKAPR